VLPAAAAWRRHRLLVTPGESRIFIRSFALFSFALKVIAYIYHLSFIYNNLNNLMFPSTRSRPKQQQQQRQQKKASFVFRLLLHPVTQLQWRKREREREKKPTTKKYLYDREILIPTFLAFLFVFNLLLILSHHTIIAWQCCFTFFFMLSFTLTQFIHTQTNTHKSGEDDVSCFFFFFMLIIVSVSWFYYFRLA